MLCPICKMTPFENVRAKKLFNRLLRKLGPIITHLSIWCRVFCWLPVCFFVCKHRNDVSNQKCCDCVQNQDPIYILLDSYFTDMFKMFLSLKLMYLYFWYLYTELCNITCNQKDIYHPIPRRGNPGLSHAANVIDGSFPHSPPPVIPLALIFHLSLFYFFQCTQNIRKRDSHGPDGECAVSSSVHVGDIMTGGTTDLHLETNQVHTDTHAEVQPDAQDILISVTHC